MLFESLQSEESSIQGTADAGDPQRAAAPMAGHVDGPEWSRGWEMQLWNRVPGGRMAKWDDPSLTGVAGVVMTVTAGCWFPSIWHWECPAPLTDMCQTIPRLEGQGIPGLLLLPLPWGVFPSSQHRRTIHQGSRVPLKLWKIAGVYRVF